MIMEGSSEGEESRSSGEGSGEIGSDDVERNIKLLQDFVNNDDGDKKELNNEDKTVYFLEDFVTGDDGVQPAISESKIPKHEVKSDVGDDALTVKAPTIFEDSIEEGEIISDAGYKIEVGLEHHCLWMASLNTEDEDALKAQDSNTNKIAGKQGGLSTGTRPEYIRARKSSRSGSPDGDLGRREDKTGREDNCSRNKSCIQLKERGQSRSCGRDKSQSKDIDQRDTTIRERISLGQRRSRSIHRSRSWGRRTRSKDRRSRSRSKGRSRSRNRTWAEKKPSASKVLGAFGLNYLLTEDDLWKIFGQYGEIEKVALPLKRGEIENKGFGFITFNTQEEAARAKECLDGTVLAHRRIRVDYSFTSRGYSPTPGRYCGRPDRNLHHRKPRLKQHIGRRRSGEGRTWRKKTNSRESSSRRTTRSRSRESSDRKSPMSRSPRKTGRQTRSRSNSSTDSRTSASSESTSPSPPRERRGRGRQSKKNCQPSWEREEVARREEELFLSRIEDRRPRRSLQIASLLVDKTTFAGEISDILKPEKSFTVLRNPNTTRRSPQSASPKSSNASNSSPRSPLNTYPSSSPSSLSQTSSDSSCSLQRSPSSEIKSPSPLLSPDMKSPISSIRSHEQFDNSPVHKKEEMSNSSPKHELLLPFSDEKREDCIVTKLGEGEERLLMTTSQCTSPKSVPSSRSFPLQKCLEFQGSSSINSPAAPPSLLWKMSVSPQNSAGDQSARNPSRPCTPPSPSSPFLKPRRQSRSPAGDPGGRNPSRPSTPPSPWEKDDD